MEIDEVTDEENLASELRRLGWPGFNHTGQVSFYLKNRVGGTIGKKIKFNDISK